MEILRLNQISPDQIILWQMGFAKITATMAYTWLIMALLLILSWLATRRISTDYRAYRWWRPSWRPLWPPSGSRSGRSAATNPDHYLAIIGTSISIHRDLSNLLMIRARLPWRPPHPCLPRGPRHLRIHRGPTVRHHQEGLLDT
jgi:F-type H+-transporting ATPase subunit a